MSSQVDDVLKQVSAELAQQGFDDQLPGRAIAQLQSIPIETEADRQVLLQGYLQLIDILIPVAPKATAEAWKTQRQQLQAQFDHMYRGANAPYAATVRITTRLVEALNHGGSADELAAQANAELAALPFDQSPEDSIVEMDGKLRVAALRVAHNWFKKVGEKVAESPFVKIIHELRESLLRDGFNKTLVLDAAQALKKEPVNSAETLQLLLSCLLHVWGMGLLLKPDAGPALEPVRDLIIELPTEVPTEQAAAPEAVESASKQRTRCDAILNELAATLERDGFSEYAFQKATAAMQELPIESEEDYQVFNEGFLRMIDITLPYAPAEAAQTLMINREAIEQQGQLDAFDRKFTPDEMREQCQALVEELRQNLANGELISPAISRAILKSTTLGLHLQDDDEEGMKLLMKTMTKDLWEVLRPYVPEGYENPFQEVVATMGILNDAVEDSNSDDQVEKAVHETQASEQFGRFSQIYDARNVPAVAGLSPHIQQFLELLPVFMGRSTRLGGEEGGEGDKAEVERLNKRFDAPLRMMQAATNEAQIIRHQREGLRRAVLEFNQFERRHHLMIVHPAFPTNAVTANPNAVFFSGADSVGEIVKQACDTIEMDLVGKHGVQNQTHGRWHQLRGAGIAVFDYSAYDPVRADPTGAVRRTLKAEAKVLSAAGPVAMVAYETGWAYVLGTPMVIVARKDQTIPFDVDIEPVRLEDDGQDVERIIFAMQTAIYGVQHGIAGDCLAETLAEVRRVYSNDDDPEVRSLLGALTDVNDATRVRQALAAVIDRIEGENPLLVLPAFPGSYPSENGRELFHVSAFREWSKPLQEEAEAACERAGVKYCIGYARMNPDIIRVIWQDICRASYVIADITNLNPNAVLELAMAQALGRPTLIMTQNKQAHKYFPAVEKVRIHQYEAENGRAKLRTLLDDFLAGAQ